MPFGFRRAVQAALLLIIIAWTAVSFYVELDKTWRRSRRVLEPQARPSNLWEIESADIHRLGEALAWADERVPPGRPLAFTSAPGRQMAASSRYSWAAYLLPGRDVIPFPAHPELFQGEYLLAYGVSPQRPDLAGTKKEWVGEHGDAVLFRVASEDLSAEALPVEAGDPAARTKAPSRDPAGNPASGDAP